MRVQLISKDNGVGLSHDVRVMEIAVRAAYPDAEVVFCDWQTPHKGQRADINVFLELLSASFLHLARRNVYVPNPEWYYSHLWGAALPRVTEVWAKTRDCEAIFQRLHRRVKYSGWTSEVAPSKGERMEKRLLHVAGASSAKGTQQVIDAVAGLPDVRITLITRQERKEVPLCVDQVVNPSDAARERYQRTHRIHLCPSTYEGFGHYINEARAMGAVVITTNAPPMNEMITRETGFGAPVALTSRQNMAVHQHVDAVALRHLVTSALNAPEEVLSIIGRRAQAAYLRERAEFHAFIKAELA